MSRDFHIYLVLFIALALSFFATLGMLPLFDLDEGAFSEATREMLESGNYLTTYLNGELRFDKPILIYWLQAVSVKLFGLNEFAMRFPSALAASFWVIATFIFVKKQSDIQKAFLSAFFMLCSLQITIIAKAVPVVSVAMPSLIFPAPTAPATWSIAPATNFVLVDSPVSVAASFEMFPITVPVYTISGSLSSVIFK